METTTSEVGRAWENILAEPSGVTLQEVRGFMETPFFRFLVESTNMARMRCLEVGCGGGKFSAGLALAGHEAVALDYSETVITGVRGLREDTSLHCQGGSFLPLRGAAERLPFPDATFDLVFNEGVVEHWLRQKERLEILREMVRVTRPSGAVVVMVPNGKHPLCWFWHLTRYPGHLQAPPMHHYSARSLAREMREVGLEIQECEGLQPLMSLCQWPRYDRMKRLADRVGRIWPEDRWPLGLRLLLGVHLVVLQVNIAIFQLDVRHTVGASWRHEARPRSPRVVAG